VTVTSTTTGAVRTAVTDAGGAFTVTNLGPGIYAVVFSLDGFAPSQMTVTLGVGDTKPANAALAIATVSETVNVSAEARVIDVQGAKIGVNVTPEEVQSLPVNGRNFANLMTLATGATSDGNGGWSSVRFNGKSNQQNYLNYDGVDGTYVWDASPGYLNATGCSSACRRRWSRSRVPRGVRSGAGRKRPRRRRQHHRGHQERRQQLPGSRSVRERRARFGQQA
jgi:hypothetical protein